jgi:hypothetical protein
LITWLLAILHSSRILSAVAARAAFPVNLLRGGGVDDGVFGDEVEAFFRAQAKMMLSFLDAGIYYF